MVLVRNALAAWRFGRVTRPFRQFANSPHTLVPGPRCSLCGTRRFHIRGPNPKGRTHDGAFAIRAGWPNRWPKEASADQSDYLSRIAHQTPVPMPLSDTHEFRCIVAQPTHLTGKGVDGLPSSGRTRPPTGTSTGPCRSRRASMDRQAAALMAGSPAQGPCLSIPGSAHRRPAQPMAS